MGDTASSGAVSVERETMVSRTRRKRDPAADLVLPDDLLLWEILVRLPAKELLRCRAACRSWCRLTCDAEFLIAHHRRQPSLPLIFFRTTDDHYTADASIDALDLKQTPAMLRPVLGFNNYKNWRSFTIHASSDGLVLLSLANGRHYICNPATHQWLKLPALNSGIVNALYRHRPSGEYRVLYSKVPKSRRDSVLYYILTVGSFQEQRCIGLPVALPSMRKKSHSWVIFANDEHPPALLHDCLHWYIDSNLFAESKVLVFDTVDESFRWMQSPITTHSEHSNDSAHLCQMDGTLGIHQVDHDTMTVLVWALQDYEAEVWSLKHKIQLPVLEITKHHVSGKGLLAWEAVSDNGDMLLSGGCIPRLLFQFDSKGKLVTKFNHDFATREVLQLSFKESLVRHVFFERRDHRKHVKLPRFFRGL